MLYLDINNIDYDIFCNELIRYLLNTNIFNEVTLQQFIDEDDSATHKQMTIKFCDDFLRDKYNCVVDEQKNQLVFNDEDKFNWFVLNMAKNNVR